MASVAAGADTGRGAGVEDGRSGTPVGASASAPNAANSAAPTAALSAGCGVVTTGSWVCSESRCVTQRNAGAAADDRQCGQTVGRCPVAFGQFVQGRDDAVQRRPNQVLQFLSGEPDVGAMTRKFDDQLGRGVGRKPFLGQPAFLAEPGERLDRRGSGGIDCRRRGCPGRELATPGRSGHRKSPRSATVSAMGSNDDAGVGQGDAGAASTEIDQSHHAVHGDSGIGLQCCQSSNGVRDQPDRLTGLRQRPAVPKSAPECPRSSTGPSAPEPRSRRRPTDRRPPAPSRRAPRPEAVRRGSSSRRGSPAGPDPRRARRSR